MNMLHEMIHARSWRNQDGQSEFPAAITLENLRNPFEIGHVEYFNAHCAPQYIKETSLNIIH